ncbi:MAG: DUF4870 domain-containing protein [Cyanobacteria bacterium P01_G01_bin.39]
MPDSNQKLNQQEQRKLLSILAHGSALLCSTVITVGVPVAIILLSQDDVVIANAKQALNFYITTYILAILFAFLIFFVVGIPLLILLWIATMIMPIFAILKISRNSDRIYRYPLVIHIL